MEFSLQNYEPLTKSIINQLKNSGFKELKIDIKEYLSFIQIYDLDYSSCITRIVYDDEYQMCLHIYKMFDYDNAISIPLKIIQTIDKLEMDLKLW